MSPDQHYWGRYRPPRPDNVRPPTKARPRASFPTIVIGIIDVTGGLATGKNPPLGARWRSPDAAKRHAAAIGQSPGDYPASGARCGPLRGLRAWKLEPRRLWFGSAPSAKAGTLSAQLDREQGRRSDLSTCANRRTKSATLTKAGISRKQAAQWEKLAAVPQEEFEAALAGASVFTGR